LHVERYAFDRDVSERINARRSSDSAVFVTCDPAASEHNSDDTAIGVWTVTPENDLLLLEVVRGPRRHRPHHSHVAGGLPPLEPGLDHPRSERLLDRHRRGGPRRRWHALNSPDQPRRQVDMTAYAASSDVLSQRAVHGLPLQAGNPAIVQVLRFPLRDLSEPEGVVEPIMAQRFVAVLRGQHDDARRD
jgi:hypothetical protein